MPRWLQRSLPPIGVELTPPPVRTPA
jgi:hypothetical protein